MELSFVGVLCVLESVVPRPLAVKQKPRAVDAQRDFWSPLAFTDETDALASV